MRIWSTLAFLSLFSLAGSLAACGDDAKPEPKVPEVTTAPVAETPAPAEQKKDIVDTAVAAGKFNTLATALKAAGLVDTLKGTGPYTVFAPTDEAFAKLPKDALDALLKDKDKLTQVLTYHVVAGKVAAADAMKLTSAKTVNGKEFGIKVDGTTVMVGGAKVIATDVEASNGVIHIIDTVLMPSDMKAEASKPDIIETAVKDGHFTTLAKALTAAGLIETLKGPGPFTVFAPTDDAFAKLPKGTLDGLLKDKEKLADILKYHVVAGKVMAADVGKMTTAKTVQGSEIKVKADAKGVTFDGKAKVTAKDIEAGNGVIHVIDSVLLPPKGKPAAKPADVAKPAAGGAKPGDKTPPKM
jgi:transforming growth factor-beta-induced protein